MISGTLRMLASSDSSCRIPERAGANTRLTDYEPVRVVAVIKRAFARASWKLILRDCYDEKFIDVFLSYDRSHSAARLKLRCCHPILHSVYCWFMPEIREVRRYRSQATALLSRALTRARVQMAKDESSENNILSWLLRETTHRKPPMMSILRISSSLWA
jgi:hypothetical protein